MERKNRQKVCLSTLFKISKSKSQEKTKKNIEETHEKRILNNMKDIIASGILRKMEEIKHRRTTERKKNIFQIIFGSDDEYTYNELIKKSTNQLKTLEQYVKIWLKYYNDTTKIIKDIKEAQILIGLVNAQVAVQLEMNNIFQNEELYDRYNIIQVSFIHCMNIIMDSYKVRHVKEYNFLLSLQKMKERDFFITISSHVRKEISFFDNFDTIPITQEKRNEYVETNAKIQTHLFLLCFDYPLTLIELKSNHSESGSKLIQSNASAFRNNYSPSKSLGSNIKTKHSKLIQEIKLNHIKKSYTLPSDYSRYFRKNITKHMLNYPFIATYEKNEFSQYFDERGCFIKIPSIFRNNEIYLLRSDEFNEISSKTDFFSRVNGRKILEGVKEFYQWNRDHRLDFIRFYFYLGYDHDCKIEDCLEDNKKFIQFFFKENENTNVKGLYINACFCGFFRHICEKLGLKADLGTPKSEFVHEIYSTSLF